MKIKLVTFAPHPNFGTCLQAYALNYVLRKMGHEVEFIYNRNETPPPPAKYYVLTVLKRILRIILPDNIINRLKEKKSMAEVEMSDSTTPVILQLPNHRVLGILSKWPGYKYFAKKWYYGNLQKRKVYKFTFKDGNFKMRRLFTHADYKKVVDDADLFITGSDQIWNPFCGGYNPMMFLEFVNDGTKCIAYSSSISQSTIHPMIEERMRDALRKFTHIAVREQRSVELLNTLLCRNNVRLVVDPTYLLTSKEWEDFGDKCELEFPLPEKYIFCYFVGDKRANVYERMVQDVKAFTGIENVITLECYNRPLNYGGGRLYNDAGPYEWVYLLRHASYICVDSFHATVFALKFRKEFVHAMKNEDEETGSQNTRMYDLLGRYGLSYKIYVDRDKTNWQHTIDYDYLYPRINAEIEDSMNYLYASIDSGQSLNIIHMSKNQIL